MDEFWFPYDSDNGSFPSVKWFISDEVKILLAVFVFLKCLTSIQLYSGQFDLQLCLICDLYT